MKILPEGDFPRPGDPGYPIPSDTTAIIPADDVYATAARLLGQGYTKGQVARILLDHLSPNGRNEEQRLIRARAKLRRWVKRDDFRDMVYQMAVVELDMEVPTILQGVAHKAKRGRVDAARLALEVTQRHNPKGVEVATNITVQIANVPRPS